MSERKKQYCVDLLNRSRLVTKEVFIGEIPLGGENTIRIQSMTTTDTMDTEESVAQSIRMIKAGSELVRLTAPSKNEAENLEQIKNKIRQKGYNTPLVADIHFTPNAAEIASRIVEKVRVNPGNYADKKKFEEINYTNESYREELERIEKKFTPLVLLCKEQKTAMRIGTNHGSLSDRILSRYGDTPEGMVESAMEFIRICEKNDFFDIVISMKASNTLVMVQAYRLLTVRMMENNRCYPTHLGVTEAGDGEDGRIKSAVGIGALLEDGIGDTIRVSLTEEPEAEIPVAQKIIKKYNNQNILKLTECKTNEVYNPFSYKKRESNFVLNIGGPNVPVVFSDLSNQDEISPANFFSFGYSYSVKLDKWHIMDQAADYVYIGEKRISFEVPGTLAVVCDYKNWRENYINKDRFYPILDIDHLSDMDFNQVFFLAIKAEDLVSPSIQNYPNAVLVIESKFDNKTQLFRSVYFGLNDLSITNPVVLKITSKQEDAESFQLYSSIDSGPMLIDGFGDGLWLKAKQSNVLINTTSFGILQATRTRISKTEYISCPSCGRTLFDLQETTAKIRARTDHLKGLKIGIMGCIVNGPGEMADADYGYVGTGPGKINLYKEKTVVKKNIQEVEAVEALVELIKDNGDWIEPVNH
ncbi:MAG: (E)-4-hydroxy-3-methylbut-2-enyl-diphosphate synthase [Crocinitomicaceae bacterium]|nr:(E)-4-hydroxy-3-methylbut-2-enyl-diphosphate synthase [Crocinitomicaceae bacterium]